MPPADGLLQVSVDDMTYSIIAQPAGAIRRCTLCVRRIGSILGGAFVLSGVIDGFAMAPID